MNYFITGITGTVVSMAVCGAPRSASHRHGGASDHRKFDAERR